NHFFRPADHQKSRISKVEMLDMAGSGSMSSRMRRTGSEGCSAVIRATGESNPRARKTRDRNGPPPRSQGIEVSFARPEDAQGTRRPRSWRPDLYRDHRPDGCNRHPALLPRGGPSSA